VSLLSKWKTEREEDGGEIPMAAMPDIAFLLLVFFMVSTTFLVTRKMNVELPSYEGKSSGEKILHVNVHLGADSLQVEYGDETRDLGLPGLQGYITGALKTAREQNEKVVLLDVQDNCSYQRVVDTFDAIRAGGGYVSLVEAEEGS
jgi:biopolymer transport protein ExbD